MYKLFDYKINTRKDAQKIYDRLLVDEKQELQKVSVRINELENSKCRYEKEGIIQKILDLWSDIENDGNYLLVPGYQDLKLKVDKLKDR